MIEHQIAGDEPEPPVEPEVITEQAEELEAEIEENPAVNDRTLATELGLDDHPGQAKAGEIIAEIEACISTLDVTALVNRHQADIEAMPPEIGASIEIAADKRRKAIEAEREKETVK
jgi:hypothetical protein